MEINQKQLDRLGELADEIDNLVYAMDLPMAPLFHVKMLKEILPDKTKVLKDIYSEITGENPWEQEAADGNRQEGTIK